MKEVHIKLTIEQYEFIVKFKKDFGIGIQKFISQSIDDKIFKLKQIKQR